MELQPVAHSDTDGDTDISRNTIGLKAIIIDLEKYMTVSNAESYPGVLLFIDHSGKQKSVDPVFIDPSDSNLFHLTFTASLHWYSFFAFSDVRTPDPHETGHTKQPHRNPFRCRGTNPLAPAGAGARPEPVFFGKCRNRTRRRRLRT